MGERGHQETARAASGIEHLFRLLGVQDADDEVHGATRREVLAAVAAKVGTDDLLVGGALGIDI